jgi:hypothetical protein
MKQRYIYLIGIVIEAILLILLINPLVGFILMFDQRYVGNTIWLVNDRLIMYGCTVIFVMISILSLLIINIIKFIKNKDIIKCNKTYIIISSIWQVLLIILPIIFTIIASFAFYNREGVSQYSSINQYSFMTTILCSITVAVFEFIKNLYCMSRIKDAN